MDPAIKPRKKKQIPVDPNLGIQEPVRFPRWPIEELIRLLDAIREPQISLRTTTQGAEMIIRLHDWTGDDGRLIHSILKNCGKELQTAFDEVLYLVLDDQLGSFSSEFTAVALKVYRCTWHRFFWRVHQGAPRLSLSELERQLDQIKGKPKLGRREKTKMEEKALSQRFRHVLRACEGLHRSVRYLTARPDFQGSELRRQRQEVLMHNRELLGDPIFLWIFDSSAFKKIESSHHKSGNEPNRQLLDPKSWQPGQLAIALLVKETGQKFSTIQRRIAKFGRQRNRI